MPSVQLEQFYLACLAHASYLLASDGVAAVIDPQRDVDLYLDFARKNGLQIAHIIETHLHADFVSGHHELAARTGAKIYIGSGSGCSFDHIPVKDGDFLQFGLCRLEFLSTPGHTTESICIAMTDLGDSSRPLALFTGDTLFVGDVGRPDLSGQFSPQQLAAMLYHSLHDKVLKLPGNTQIFPAHGAGSLCGRQMSSERSSTIERERQTNYALKAQSEEEFVRLLTGDLPPKPEYFLRDVEINRRGAATLSEIAPPVPLRAPNVLQLQNEGAVVLDTRPTMQFAVAHIPGSIHIALSGQYASWAGRILGLDKRIILVGEDTDHVRESQLRLARVGIENVAAYLEDGIAGWIAAGYELDYIPQVSVQEFAELLEKDKEHITVLDVREPGEVDGGAIADSIRIPLGQLQGRTKEVPRDKLVVVHCKGGYRSSIASSILRQHGFQDLANLTGGFDAWKAISIAPA